MSENLMGASVPDTACGNAQNEQLTPLEKHAAFLKEHYADVARIVKAVDKDPRYAFKAPERPITVAGKKPLGEKHDYQ